MGMREIEKMGMKVNERERACEGGKGKWMMDAHRWKWEWI